MCLLDDDGIGSTDEVKKYTYIYIHICIVKIYIVNDIHIVNKKIPKYIVNTSHNLLEVGLLQVIMRLRFVLFLILFCILYISCMNTYNFCSGSFSRGKLYEKKNDGGHEEMMRVHSKAT